MEQGPPAESKDARSAAFRSPACQAEMTFDAAAQRLACQHCGETVAVAAEEGQRSIVEHDLRRGLAHDLQQGLGLEVRTSRCEECGATVSFPPQVTATACAFCGSARVLDQAARNNLIRPESVVPFQVDQATATRRFADWLRRLWFRPSDLKRRARVQQVDGVYVPYWTFDAAVSSSWTAEAGYYYYVTEQVTETDAQGREVHKTRRVQHTRWEPAWGSRADAYDDVLICASRGLPADLVMRLSSFDTHGLKPYEPSFLAGWKAEEYSVDLDEAWTRAVKLMESSQVQRCGQDVPGDTHRRLSVTNRFSGETFKHVLLPIWISAYRYGDKIYRFLVNGQTGEVVGKAPWSVLKIALFIAGLLLAAALAYLYLRTPAAQGGAR